MVEAHRPTTREWVRRVRVTGTAHGEEETTLAAKAPGRIVTLMADLGDSVAAGDPLLQVDPTDAALARDERTRAFRQALARVGLSELPPDDFDIALLPTVERARLQMDNAKSRYERGQSLMENDPPLISTQDFADLRTAWDVAQSNLRVEQLSAAATLAEARTLEAQVRIAEQRVQDTLHRAPGADGATGNLAAKHPEDRTYAVASRLVSVGDFVQVGTPLMRLVDADPLIVRARVPERMLGTVQVNQGATVRTEAVDQSFAGTVTRISPAVDTQTRTFLIEITVPNPQRLLKPGSFASVQIDVGREPVLAIPDPALVVFAGVNKVFVVVGNKLEERRVELGDRANGWIEVRSGLRDDELVVVNPTGSMIVGTPVSIAEGN